jgi:hypothetical protein
MCAFGLGVKMKNLMLVSLIGAILAAGALSSPASADVIYNLTFTKSSTVGTGVLDLNRGSVAQAYNLNGTLGQYFTSFTTTALDGYGPFSVTTANLASYSYIQTGSAGQFYNLSLVETGTNVITLDLYTNTWQIHAANNSTLDSGSSTIVGPTLAAPAAIPEPVTLSLFGAGLAGAIGMRRRKAKRS